MVTYKQLEAESYWGREESTPETKWLVAQLRAYFGVGADALGQKGDNKHLNGGHRSQEWILHSKYCTNHTYTVESGLTAEQARYLSAIDLTPKNKDTMLLISQRIDRVTRAGHLEEVVEWYGNVNGDARVDGWDNIRNMLASSDSSHLWHLHIRIGRKFLRSMEVMRRIYAALTGTTAPQEEEDMGNYNFARLDIDPTGAVFLTDFGGTSIWVQNEADKRDYETLASEGRLSMKSTVVRVIGNRRLFGEILGPKPDWWTLVHPAPESTPAPPLPQS